MIALILALTLPPALAQGPGPLRLPFGGATTDDVARRRAENHRRECEARWQGLAARGRAEAPQDAYVADCIAAQGARCRPRGSDPRCDYSRRRAPGGR
ncbi:MAG: hypothetical protein JNK46_00255 [Methylobacteriaceae bacterium]|nr:hypothetical protein [Methylobacteriaceae bacterium]